MNATLRYPALALGLLLLSGCSRESMSDNDAALYQSNTAALTPGVQSVRVGEGGRRSAPAPVSARW